MSFYGALRVLPIDSFCSLAQVGEQVGEFPPQLGHDGVLAGFWRGLQTQLTESHEKRIGQTTWSSRYWKASVPAAWESNATHLGLVYSLHHG